MAAAKFVCSHACKYRGVLFFHFHSMHPSVRAGRHVVVHWLKWQTPETAVSQNSRSERGLNEFHKGTMTQKGNIVGNHWNPLLTAMVFCILLPFGPQIRATSSSTLRRAPKKMDT